MDVQHCFQKGNIGFQKGNIVRFRANYGYNVGKQYTITSRVNNSCYLNDSSFSTPLSMLELVTQKYKIISSTMDYDSPMSSETFVKKRGFPPLPLMFAKKGDKIYQVKQTD